MSVFTRPILFVLVLAGAPLVAGCGHRASSSETNPAAAGEQRPSSAMVRELPRLPRQGIAVSNATDSWLVDLSGKKIARLAGLTLEPVPFTPPIFVNIEQTVFWTLQAARHQLIGSRFEDTSGGIENIFTSTTGTAPVIEHVLRLPFGCLPIVRLDKIMYAECGFGELAGAIIRSDSAGHSEVLARTSSEGKDWSSIELSPDGKELLATESGSGRCVRERAVVIPVNRKNVVSFDGRGLGFSTAGQPIVFAATGNVCNATGSVVVLGEKRPRVLARRVHNAAIWGDAGRTK